MTVSPLYGIQSSLARTRRRRAVTRISVGLLIVLLTTVGLLAALFGLDLCFHFSILERAGLLIAFLALSAWSFVRWLFPALVHRESELQLALWIERDHPEHRGRLANAMQFASVDRGTWGSHSLVQATVDQAATLDRLPPLVDPQAIRCGRLVLAGLLAMATVGGVIDAFPEESRVFASRLFLGTARYPTRTVITRILVNGIPASINRDAIRIPTGDALEFSVECAGQIPDRGTVQLQTEKTRREGTLLLEPVVKGSSGETLSRDPANTSPRLFSATVNRLLDDVLFRIQIGDAVIGPLRIEVLPLPAISIEVAAIPPEYVHRTERIFQVGSPPQISVPMGSRAEVTVQCRNKELRSAVLRVEGHEYSLEREPADGGSFRLRADNTPLASVVSPLAYEVSVVDADGLRLREPVRGLIGVIRDELPRVDLSVTTLHVLPEAEPSIVWAATDDHGLKSVRLQWQVTGPAGSREGVIPLYSQTSGAPGESAARGTSRLAVAPLKATLSDEIRLTLVATDDRGSLAGVEGTSEPVILHVTDEAGILSALATGDHKASRELDELIERQLRSGAGR